MKKLFLLFLLVAPAFGQTFSGYSGADTFVLPPWRLCMGNDPGAHNACFMQSESFDKTAYLRGQLDYEFTTTTISQLPSASAIYNLGRTYWIMDGIGGSDCTVGGSNTFVLCVSNGITWVPIGGTGGNSSGTIGICGSSNCDTYYPFANVATVAGDPSATDDGAGHKTAKSLGLTDPTQAGFFYLTQGTAPTVSATNSLYFYAPSSVTSYALIPPGTAGTGCVQAANSSGIVTLSFTGVNCGTGSGGNIQAQTNGVNNANCTGSSCPLLNFVNSPTVTASNPSGGIESFSINGAGTLSNPSQPTITPKGSTGAASYTYGIVGCEDASCAYHSALSTTGSTSSGNATLSSSNYNQISAYGDTLYGYRGYIVCRTAGGSTQGVITGGLQAGKIFNDTGLSGDGSNCATTYASNTTITYPVCLGSSLPGYPSVPGAPCGVDGPPLSPNALDDEMTQTYGAPGDVNDPFWAWITQGSATAAWTNGTTVLTSDTSGNVELLEHSLPSSPFTFVAFVDAMALNQNDGCEFGMRESGTGKIAALDVVYNQPSGTSTPSAANGGWMFLVLHGTSTSSGALSAVQINGYYNNAAYIKIQVTGGNIIYSYSPPWDGVNFIQLKSEALTTPFTTAPDNYFISTRSSTTNTVCTIDYVRRTQ